MKEIKEIEKNIFFYDYLGGNVRDHVVYRR